MKLKTKQKNKGKMKRKPIPPGKISCSKVVDKNGLVQ